MDGKDILVTKTADYRPSAHGLPVWWWSWGNQQFSYNLVEWMLLDPQVRLGLRMLRAPLAKAQFVVDCPNAEVRKFCIEQLVRLWKHRTAIVRSFEYGWSAAEVLYRLDAQGRICVDGLKDFHPLDVRPITYTEGPQIGQYAGFSVRGMKANNGKVWLPGPYPGKPAKGLWIANEAKFGRLYGESVLVGCYLPWDEKNSKDGFRQLRLLWWYKNSYDNGIVRHPEGINPEDGRPYMDYAREMGEKMRAGASLTLPSSRDEHGQYQWEYERPQAPQPPPGMQEYKSDLDDDILIGMGVPPEIFKSDSSGAYAGVRVPQQAFYEIETDRLRDFVRQVCTQVVIPLAELNFGRTRIDVDVKPLAPPDPQSPAQPDGGDGDDGGFGSQRIPQPKQPPARQQPEALRMAGEKVEEEEPAFDLAAVVQDYVDQLNERVEAGEEIAHDDDHLASINEDLEDTRYRIDWHDGRWVLLDYGEHADDDEPLRMAAGTGRTYLRAPKGGVTIHGRFYAGGRFIPGGELRKASAGEKLELERKLEKQVEDKSPATRKPKPNAKDLRERFFSHEHKTVSAHLNQLKHLHENAHQYDRQTLHDAVVRMGNRLSTQQAHVLADDFGVDAPHGSKTAALHAIFGKLRDARAEAEKVEAEKPKVEPEPQAEAEPTEPQVASDKKRRGKLATNVPEHNPRRIEKWNYKKVKDEVKGKYVPREPKEGESLLSLDRPQTGPYTFHEYQAGDLIQTQPDDGWVVVAAKPGFVMGGEGFRKWKQLVVARKATPEDYDATKADAERWEVERQKAMRSMLELGDDEVAAKSHDPVTVEPESSAPTPIGSASPAPSHADFLRTAVDVMDENFGHTRRVPLSEIQKRFPGHDVRAIANQIRLENKRVSLEEGAAGWTLEIPEHEAAKHREPLDPTQQDGHNQRVREAFAELSKPGESLPVWKLRDAVPDMPKRSFDEAVRELWRGNHADLSPISDLSRATEEQLRKSVRNGDEHLFHLEPKAKPTIAPKPEDTTDAGREGTAAAAKPGVGAEPGRGAGLGGSDRDGDRGTGKQPAGRIVTARAHLTKPADTRLVPESLRGHLNEHQQHGVAKAIEAMDAHGGFLLADGTGVGKTRQQLAVAKTYADKGKKVLIVTKNEVIKPNWKKGAISGSFADDSAAMGIGIKLNQGDAPINPGEVHVTTYDNLGDIKSKIDKDTAIIFDESHSLKNWGSARSKHGYEMSKAAGAVMYATATPADKPLHIAHLFRAKIFGNKPWDETYKELGMRQVSVRTPNGTIQKWEIDPHVGAAESYRRMAGLFDRMTEDGLMVKREISFDGVDVGFEQVSLEPHVHETLRRIEQAAGGPAKAAQAMMDEIKDQLYSVKDQLRYAGEAVRGAREGDAGYDMKDLPKHKADAERLYRQKHELESELEALRIASSGKLNPGLAKAITLMHQRRQQEPHKIPHVVDSVKKELAEGRQVVIFASRVNESKVKDAGGETIAESEGTAKLLRQALENEGIKEITELHGGSKKKAPEAMGEFQSGKARVIIATVESGGTGINLDDTAGDKPRTMIMMTPPFSAVENVQAAGRVWRLKTKSAPRLRYVFGDTEVDRWNASLIASKMKTLGAAVGGEVGHLDLPTDMSAEGTAEMREETKGAATAAEPYKFSPRVRQPEPPAAKPEPKPSPAAAPSADSPKAAEPKIRTRKVKTSRGDRHVTDIEPGEAFWRVWKTNRPDYVTARKNPSTGRWEAAIWGDNEDDVYEKLQDLKKRMGVRMAATVAGSPEDNPHTHDSGRDAALAFTDRIIKRAAVAGRRISDACKAEILAAVKKKSNAAELIVEIARILRRHQPLLARALHDATVAAWIAGARDAAESSPTMQAIDNEQEKIAEFITPGSLHESLPVPVQRDDIPLTAILPPDTQTDFHGAITPPETGIVHDEPIVDLPIIREGAEWLGRKRVMLKEDFERLGASAREKAFTVARLDTEEAIGRVHEALTQTIRDGASLDEFERRLADTFETTPLAPNHLETVYRTGVQSAYSAGQEEILADPLIGSDYPYRAYFAIHDNRARPDHLALEKLGIQGTNIYRADDPVWKEFRPAWDFGCRCGWSPVSIEQAAERGIREAIEWQRTGVQPHPPAHVQHPPFRAPAGFQREGV